MSQENIEIVRDTYKAFNARGVEGVLEYVATDAIWYPFPEWVEASEYPGHEGVRRLVAVWTENFDEFAIEMHDLRAVGDQVIALTEQTGRIKGTGVPVRQPVGAVYSDFGDGTSAKTQFFQTWREALEAVGLSEQDAHADS